MRLARKRGLTASITLAALTLLLMSGIGIASLMRTEPLISDNQRKSAARATPDTAPVMMKLSSGVPYLSAGPAD